MKSVEKCSHHSCSGPREGLREGPHAERAQQAEAGFSRAQGPDVAWPPAQIALRTHARAPGGNRRERLTGRGPGGPASAGSARSWPCCGAERVVRTPPRRATACRGSLHVGTAPRNIPRKAQATGSASRRAMLGRIGLSPRHQALGPASYHLLGPWLPHSTTEHTRGWSSRRVPSRPALPIGAPLLV